MIAVSPYSTGGRISHVYNEHSSVVKFIERNWMLNTTLSDRSRDNLPNPLAASAGQNTYVPRNMPAIGDLFDLFDFGSGGGQHKNFFSTDSRKRADVYLSRFDSLRDRTVA